MAADAPRLPVIPDYEMLRLVGSGSYGDVWLARGITGLYRAIKVVWRERFREPEPFEREFRGLRKFAAISLLEPRQLALLHIGRNDAAGFFYYVMELADDVATGREVDPARYVPRTLREARTGGASLPAKDCVALGVELARALASLHAHGLVHRDVKPSNIIIVGGVPKLADVGLVAAANQALSFVGTEGFVAPEGPGTAAGDVYSLGKVLYELATGLDRKDFPRLPPGFGDRPDHKELLELNTVVLRACDPSRARRHPDATALLDDLLLIQAGRSVRRLRAAERRLGRALRSVAVFAVLATAGVIGAVVERGRARAAEAERDAMRRWMVYADTLRQTQAAIRDGGFGRARQNLASAETTDGADLRGFEWRALRQQAQGDASQVWRDAGPPIDRVTLSPDETLLAVHDESGVITLCHVATGDVIRRIEGVHRLADWSPDGAWLIGTDRQYDLQRWRVDDGSAGVAHGAGGICRPLGVVQDGGVVAFVDGSPARILVWDFAQKRARAIVELPTREGGDEWEFFRGAADAAGNVALAWVLRAGAEPRFRLSWVRAGAGAAVVFSECAQRPSAVGCDARGAWAVLDVTGAELRLAADGVFRATGQHLPAETRRRVALGNALELVAHQNQLSWFEGTTPDPRRIARGHGGAVADVAVAAAGAIFSGSIDGQLRRWSARAESAASPAFQGWDSNGNASQVVFTSPRHLCVPVDGRDSTVLAVDTLQPTVELRGLRYPLRLQDTDVAGVGAMGWLAARLDSGEMRGAWGASVGPVQLGAIAAGNGAGLCLDRAGRLWHFPPAGEGVMLADDWQDRFALVTDDRATRLWASGNGAGHNRLLVGWSVEARRELWRRTMTARVPSLLLLPDQRRLVVTLEDGAVEVIAAETGITQARFPSGSTAPQALALSPRADRMFVGGSEGQVHVFATGPWVYLCSLSLPVAQRVLSLACAPDARLLAVQGEQGLVQLIAAP